MAFLILAFAVVPRIIHVDAVMGNHVATIFGIPKCTHDCEPTSSLLFYLLNKPWVHIPLWEENKKIYPLAILTPFEDDYERAALAYLGPYIRTCMYRRFPIVDFTQMQDRHRVLLNIHSNTSAST